MYFNRIRYIYRFIRIKNDKNIFDIYKYIENIFIMGSSELDILTRDIIRVHRNFSCYHQRIISKLRNVRSKKNGRLLTIIFNNIIEDFYDILNSGYTVGVYTTSMVYRIKYISNLIRV